LKVKSQKSKVKFLSIGVFVALFLALIDQILKFFLKNTFKNRQSFFGFIQNKNKFITIILPVAILLVLLIVFIKTINNWHKVALFAIIAGGFSNLIDRVRFGATIDYLVISNFSKFNIADLMIYGGIIMALVHLLEIKIDNS